jgi:hypothetical protein
MPVHIQGVQITRGIMNVIMTVDKTAVTSYEIFKKFLIKVEVRNGRSYEVIFFSHDTYCEFRS